MSASCINVLSGQGRINSDYFIVVDTPSQDDDLYGLTLSSKEGDIIRRILDKAGIDKNAVYLTYLVKCRVEGPPLLQHVKACSHWLEQELAGVNPKFVITMGEKSTRYFTKKSVSEVLYQEIKLTDFTVFPTYSPNYILSRSKAKFEEAVQKFDYLRQQVQEIRRHYAKLI